MEDEPSVSCTVHWHSVLHRVHKILFLTVVFQVLECYVNVSQWKDAEMWYSRVNSLQSQYSPSSDLHSALNLQSDLNQIRYMCAYVHN